VVDLTEAMSMNIELDTIHSTFALVDTDHSEYLDIHEFKQFIDLLSPMKGIVLLWRSIVDGTYMNNMRRASNGLLQHQSSMVRTLEGNDTMNTNDWRTITHDEIITFSQLNDFWELIQGCPIRQEVTTFPLDTCTDGVSFNDFRLLMVYLLHTIYVYITTIYYYYFNI
jgi:hypothetical protein